MPLKFVKIIDFSRRFSKTFEDKGLNVRIIFVYKYQVINYFDSIYILRSTNEVI